LKAAVVIDPWKRAVFIRHLGEAGYQWEEFNPGPVKDTILLRVTTDDVDALALVVAKANRECAQ
jgi:hypothetical protein